MRDPGPALTSWLVLLCHLLVTNEMAGALVLSNGLSRTLSLNSGLVTRLAYDASLASPVIGLAILLPVMLLTIFYWWLVRSSLVPLIDLLQRDG